MSADRSEVALLLNHLADEFAERYRRGERPGLQEYVDRHPQLAEEIREFFPAMVEMEQAKQDLEAMSEPHVAGPLPPLERLGDYRIIREISRGGMGVVYEAEQESLGRRVALKVLAQSLPVKHRTHQRFEREAKSAARLHHTNIVPVFGFGEHHGVLYYVMQFIQGLGLDQVVDELKQMRAGGQLDDGSAKRDTGARVARSLLTGQFALEADAPDSAVSGPVDVTLDRCPQGNARQTGAPSPPPNPSNSSNSSARLSLSNSSVVLPGTADGSSSSGKPMTFWQSVARIGIQVASALEYAHRQGILHRDIKPSNLLLDTHGTVWVTDFGLAKTDDQQNLTETGDVLGTIRYMPPEAFEGRSDARSDIYALGLTLYELACLQPAFHSTDRHRLIKQVAAGQPPRLNSVNSQAPRDLVTIIHKAIERDARHRYATAHELAEDLRRFAEDEPIRARPISVLEQSRRWARRNKGLAASLAAVAMLLVVIALSGAAMAAYFKRQEVAQRIQAAKNERLAKERESARLKATRATEAEQAARQRVETVLIDLHTSHGLMAAERQESARAILWFANAARLAAHDPDREKYNRLRVRSWGREVVLPVAALCHDGRELALVEFQPGGPLLLTVTRFGEFRVWDWQRGEMLTWALGQTAVTSAAWSPDGRHLALGLPSGKVEFRSATTGDLVRELDHPGPVTALTFSRDGQWLAMASDIVRVWDCRSQVLLPAVWRHPRPVQALVFNPAGDRLATACLDWQVRLFAVNADERTPAPLFAPLPHKPGRRSRPVVSAPAFIDKGRGLLTVTESDQLTWWDASTGKPTGFERFSTGIDGEAPGIVSSHDGQHFAYGTWTQRPNPDGSRMWSLASGDPTGVPLRHDNGVIACAFSPDDRFLVTGSWDRTAKIWSVSDGRLVAHPLAHQDRVSQVAFTDDGLFLATAEVNGLVRVWRWPLGNEPLKSQPYGYAIARLKASADHRFAIMGRFLHPTMSIGRHIPFLRVYDTATGEMAGPEFHATGGCMDAALASDGALAAAVTSYRQENSLHVWSVRSGERIYPAIPLPGPPLSVSISADDARIATLCNGGTVAVVNASDGHELVQFQPEGWQHETPMASLQFSPCESALAVNAGPSLHICDSATGDLLVPPMCPQRPGDTFLRFTFSSDGRHLATMTRESHTLRVWSVATGKPLSAALPHAATVYHICFDPSGDRLFTVGADGQARLWDWRSGTLACAPCQLDRASWNVAVSADGKYGLTAFRSSTLPEGSLRVSEFTTGKPLTPALGSQFPSLSFVISADGTRALVHADRDGRLFLVDLAVLSESDELSADDLCQLAELATGQRIHEGDLVRLSSDQWLDRWQQFQQRNRAYIDRMIQERMQQ